MRFSMWDEDEFHFNADEKKNDDNKKYQPSMPLAPALPKMMI